jgi:hypothetical protein
MKNAVILFVLVLGMYLGAQNDQELIKNEKKIIFGTSLSIGHIVLPERGYGLSIGLEFKNKDLVGFGMSLSTSSYNAIDLNNSPSLNEIENYDSEIDQPFDKVDYVDGNIKDDLMIVAFHLSKAYKLNKRFITDVQIGPSFNFFNRNVYSYSYNPPFGSFSGSTSGGFFAKASESKLLIIGFNLKASLLYSFNANTVISLGPYIDFNKEASVFGLQLGFVFGKKYKRNLFN